MAVHMCGDCYTTECKRRGANGLEIYTSGQLAALFKCDYCPAKARYSVPGKMDDYAPLLRESHSEECSHDMEAVGCAGGAAAMRCKKCHKWEREL